MLSPSTAPRWKIAISCFARGARPQTRYAPGTKARNPRLTRANAPFFRKIRREFIRPSESVSESQSAISESDADLQYLIVSETPATRASAPPPADRRGRFRDGGARRSPTTCRPEAPIARTTSVCASGSRDAEPSVRSSSVERDVHATDERAGVRPRVGRVLVARWRLALIERHPELLHRSHEGPRVDTSRRPSHGPR